MKDKEAPFDFEQFARQAAVDLKSGKPIVGSGGVFTPLLKRIIEASLEGELDAMYFKVRDNGTVKAKAIYSILGVSCEGEKEVIGIYFGEHESSTFWRAVLHELQLRGVKDIFVACMDNLKGFADAIEDIFPQTDVQLCLVHQMRNSMKCP